MAHVLVRERLTETTIPGVLSHTLSGSDADLRDSTARILTFTNNTQLIFVDHCGSVAKDNAGFKLFFFDHLISLKTDGPLILSRRESLEPPDLVKLHVWGVRKETVKFAVNTFGLCEDDSLDIPTLDRSPDFQSAAPFEPGIIHSVTVLTQKWIKLFEFRG